MEEVRGFLDLVKAGFCSENEDTMVKLLQRFCQKNSNQFAFQDIELSLRKEFIDGLLKELNTHEHNTQFVVESLSALRILSRDKDGLGILTSEHSCVTLLTFAGLCCSSEVKGSHEIENQKPVKSSATDFESSVEIMDVDSVVVKLSVVEEALKCLCNLIFQSSTAREFCSKHNCTLALLKRHHKWFEQLPGSVKLFDMRLLFLFTALDSRERLAVLSSGGLAVLVRALDACVPGNAERERCEEAGDQRDSYGQEDDEKLTAMNVMERTATEATPKIYPMTEEQVTLTAEILKAIFNVTLSGTVETEKGKECQRLILIARSILVQVVPSLPCTVPSEQLFNNTLNVLSNMPQPCLPYLMWQVPSSVAKKLLQDYESSGRQGKFSPVYEKTNMFAIKVILEQLDRKLVQSQGSLKESLMPTLSALYQMSKENRMIRKYLRHEILPPLGLVGHKRPEEGDRLGNQLIQQMTAPVMEIKDLVANFLFVLCKENVDRLVKYTGFGNAAGLLARNGLLGEVQATEGEYSSDEDSDTEEYASVKAKIDPITGAVPTNDGEPNPLASMSEEEKECEAEKLAHLIKELHAKGIIKPLHVGADGKLEEFVLPTEDDNGDSSG